jgi:GT2 family glycosyltransferase/glycosyltransferase involved in cell wall biosynthesis
MLTRMLHVSGLELGPESELMPAQADNPDGFWEHLRFVALNDEVLNLLGGAWDLPPSADADSGNVSVAPLRMKAKRLVGKFDFAKVWGWKDPRNSLTLPFWKSILPELKALVVVRNPLEVAYSMHERNGTSHAFGLRLWEIYNRRILDATTSQERLVTRYDAFFENPEKELIRIANFIGLPLGKVNRAAALVAQRRRHTHFTIEQLIDAGVSPELVALYRALITEADGSARDALASPVSSAKKGSKAKKGVASLDTKSGELEILPGAISRLHAPVSAGETAHPTEAALRSEIENLHREIQKQTARLSPQGAGTSEMEKKLQSECTTYLQEIRELSAKTESLAASLQTSEAELQKVQKLLHTKDISVAESQARAEKLAASLQASETELEKVRKLFHAGSVSLAESEARSDQLMASLKMSETEIKKVRKLFHVRSVSLAESDARSDQLMASLRRQLQAAKKLTRLLDDLEVAAQRLRSSRRWQIANPVAALKEMISPGSGSLGYGHLEKIVSAYRKWLASHPEVAAIDDQIRMLALGAVPPASFTSDEGNRPGRAEHLPPVPTKPIEFPIHTQVEISVIIPVFNQLDFTQACLASLQEHQDVERFEVIVVDDASTDATPDVIGKIRGLVYLRNETNSGFTSSCNRGAKKARGSHLLFLNNDTAVTPGWLSALYETFGNEPNAGLVGSKLVFPDGRLQEAGGIIWRDGSGWNRGKFGDPDKPEYNFLCEVDYCSAACVMIPKSVFEGVGGFDPKYSPAYYEDTDLAFKVRRAGFKVLYQPLSRVVHYEGATGGTDLQTGAKKHQEINRTTFVRAWADVLAEKPANGDLASHDRLKPEQKRVLVIDHHVPMPDRDSGSLRMFQMLKILHGLGHRMTFLPDNLANIAPYGAELQRRGIELAHHPYVTSVKDYLAAHGHEFDIVVLSRCDFARKHIANARQYAPQSRIIFDTVDLHFLRDSREAELTQDAGAKVIAQKKRQQEYEIVDQSDETWVVSSVERELLRKERPNKSIEVVSNIVDVPGSRTPFSRRRDFLFIGSFQHRPNIDAVLFFTKEIYPAVKRHLPNAKFYVIGDKAPPEVVALASESIVVTGRQPDVQPYFDNVKLSVAPLRWGAGVKGKINQSMSFGVPVVGTSIAVEGMTLNDREDVMVADEPDHFAKALIELYESEELWKRLSQNAIAKTQNLYSVSAAERQLRKLFNHRQA